tara:strand:+ start:2282 stop:3037 length:756 start_codon:yes stop_codon:yes gene_type:complete
MSKNPDFIICGFQKCATSALSHNLTQHPKINIARTDHELAKLSMGKEINFFAKGGCSTYHMGIEWYKSHFKNDNNLWGEVSPNYSEPNDFVVHRMRKYLNNTKFIFSLRNPIYRTFSAYNHYMQLANGGIKFGEWNEYKSLIFNLENSPTVFTRNYAPIIQKFTNFYNKKYIHLIIQEKLNSVESQIEFNKIFSFMGIDNIQIQNDIIHQRPYAREITSKEKSYLYEYHKEDVQNLFDIIGYKIKEWKEFC